MLARRLGQNILMGQDVGSWAMAMAMGHGPWPKADAMAMAMGHGSWAMSHRHGPWPMGHAWAMGMPHGPWPMSDGQWATQPFEANILTCQDVEGGHRMLTS